MVLRFLKLTWPVFVVWGVIGALVLSQPTFAPRTYVAPIRLSGTEPEGPLSIPYKHMLLFYTYANGDVFAHPVISNTTPPEVIEKLKAASPPRAVVEYCENWYQLARQGRLPEMRPNPPRAADEGGPRPGTRG